MEKIINHVTITWGHGKDIAYVIMNMKLPMFVELAKLTNVEAAGLIYRPPQSIDNFQRVQKHVMFEIVEKTK